MKYVFPKNEPTGERPIINKFLFFPKTLKNPLGQEEMRWLERAAILRVRRTRLVPDGNYMEPCPDLHPEEYWEEVGWA